MTKFEFLEELKNALAGEVSSEAMMDAYSYYSNYIESELRNGKTEEQVLLELGKPNLIARSIIAAQGKEREADLEYTEDGRTKKVHHSSFMGKTQEEREENEEKRKMFLLQLSAWSTKLLFWIVLFVIFALLVLVVWGILHVGIWIILTFGIPILLGLGIIYLVMYFLK